MSLRTPNSSFIFDRRRRSMIEWAVFLAIFLPAAEVAEGCFLFGDVGFVVEDEEEGMFASSFGFI